MAPRGLALLCLASMVTVRSARAQDTTAVRDSSAVEDSIDVLLIDHSFTSPGEFVRVFLQKGEVYRAELSSSDVALDVHPRPSGPPAFVSRTEALPRHEGEQAAARPDAQSDADKGSWDVEGCFSARSGPGIARVLSGCAIGIGWHNRPESTGVLWFFIEPRLRILGGKPRGQSNTEIGALFRVAIGASPSPTPTCSSPTSAMSQGFSPPRASAPRTPTG